MKNRCIGIGKELGKWERRAPLCPVHVQMLTQVLPHLISVLSLVEASPSNAASRHPRPSRAVASENLQRR